MDGTDLETIIAAMVGRDLGEMFPHVPHEPGAPVLELSRSWPGTRSARADLVVRRGEILGIAGLVGAGRTDCSARSSGSTRSSSGRVVVKGIERQPRDPPAADRARASGS